jgi:phage gp36-like protein
MYSEAKDIRLLLGDPPEREVPSRLIAIAQRKAAVVVNSLCRNRYQIPFVTPYPDEAISWEEDLAIYYISRTKYFAKTSGITIEQVQEHYDKTLSALKGVAKGTVVIDGTNVVRYERVHSETLDVHRVFDTLNELEWGPDTDYQQVLLDRRAEDS